MTKFSLAHLTVLGLSPPDAARTAADLGYDFVSFRIIPLGLPGEPRHVVAEDKALLRETKQALASARIPLLDIELARIVDGVDVRQFEPHLEAGAELGAKHLMTAIYTPDEAFAADAFAQLCALAAQYKLSVNLEFIAFSAVNTLAKAVAVVRKANQPNAAVMVDTLHCGFTRMAPGELDGLSASLFNYAQLGDAKLDGDPDTAEMTRIAREERYFPGEGVIPIKEIIARLPDMPLSLEITHKKRIEEFGYREFARQALAATKKYLGEARTR